MSYNCLVFAFFAAVMFSTIQTGYGFKCWFCSSQIDRRCGDTFNSTDAIRHEECNSGYYPNSNIRFVCRKIKYRGENNEVFVSRSCTQEGDRENDPCSVSQLSTYGRVEHCSVCSTDLCNSAPALFQITSAVVGPVIIFLTKINIL